MGSGERYLLGRILVKICIVIDNDTLGDDLIPEAGFSAFIAEDGKNILFDTGREGNVIGNAEKLGVDLTNLDYIVLSHGHHDHTNGIENLVQLYAAKGIDKEHRPTVIVHPDAFYPRYSNSNQFIGSKLSKEEVESNFNVIYSTKPKNVTDNLVFLGEIPLTNDFEGKKLGKMHKNGEIIDDYIIDDSALVYKSNKGLVIISGCSHRGICNILDYAIKVTGENRIDTVIGGFHLKNENPEFIARVVDELEKYNINKVHACHCTGEVARDILKRKLPQQDIGCSSSFHYER